MQVIQFDRETGGGVRTTDSASLSISDNIDLRIRLIMPRWIPNGNEHTFFSKRQAGDEWQFRTQDLSGRLQFVWWDTGGTPNVETASADIPFDDGQTGWIRVTRSGTSVTFYYSETDTNDHASVTWTQLGAVQTTPSGSMRSNVASHILIGSAFAFVGGESLDGYVYAAAILSGGTPVATPDFTDTTQWAVGDDFNATGVDAQGNTWQINLGARIIGDNIRHLPGVVVGVQVAFGETFTSISEESVVALDWYDITEDVRTIHLERGKNYELDRIDAGVCTLELENFDGKYNAHNTTSPYSPNVLPMVPIRVRAIYNGVLYPLWRGFVQRWPVTTTPDNSLARVECIDLFGPLAMADVVQIDRTTIVDSLNPVAWWRFGSTDDEIGSNDLSFNGSPTVGGAPGAWEGDTATTFDGTNDTAVPTTAADVVRGGLDMTWEGWVRPHANASGAHYIWSIVHPVSGHAWQMLYLFDSVIHNDYVFALHNGVYYSGPITIAEWHHIALTFNATTGQSLFYVDGRLENSFSTHPIYQPKTGATATIGDSTVGGSALYDGEISEIAVYPTVLTDTEIASLYAAQFEGFATELTSDRIEFVLNESEFLGASIIDYVLEPGATTMDGVSSPTNGTALQTIFDAVDTERGWFFIAGDGRPVFQSRHYRIIQQSTPIATIDETDYDEIEAGVDDGLLLNDISVSPGGDDPFRSQDADSIERFGKRSLSLTIYPDNPNEAQDHADYLVAQYADPVTRISFLGFEILQTSPIATLLGAEIGDRYNIEAPMNGDDLDLDCHLEKITHDIALDKRWRTSWQLSPASTESFWLMGVAGFGEIGETTRLGY